MGANWTGLTGASHGAVYSRVPVSINEEYNILNWDNDNLYPQRMEQVKLDSALTKSAIEVVEDFLNGQGWTTNNDKVVNRFGETMHDILNAAAQEAANYSGAFALHMNFDGSGKAVEIQNVPVMYVRFRVPRGRAQRMTHVVVSNNWEQADTKNKGEVDPVVYPLLNPLTAADETIRGGRGQIMFFTNTMPGLYPLMSYDSIEPTARADSGIANWEKNHVTRGFHGSVFFKYPGKLNGADEERQIADKVNAALGDESPGAQIVEVDEEFTSELFEVVEGLQNGDIFTATLDSIESRVLSALKIPPPLLGINPDGGVFTQLAYFEAHNVFRIQMRTTQNKIARAINKVTELAGFSVGQIIENDLGVIPNFGNNQPIQDGSITN